MPNSRLSIFAFAFLIAVCVRAEDAIPPGPFEQEIRPVLVKFCGECHGPKSKDVPFLKAGTAAEIGKSRSIWRSVVSQLRNRTMPPAEELQPGEAERIRAAAWLETFLRDTACSGGEFAGSPMFRRLNRLEYDNTIRDLLDLKLNFSETFPTDGGGGEGFNNNGETLYLPAILMERYLEAAQQILDEAVITPPLSLRYVPKDFAMESGGAFSGRLKKGESVALSIGCYVTADYTVTLDAGAAGDEEVALSLKIDGIAAHQYNVLKKKSRETALRLQRGVHTIAIQAGGDADLSALTVIEKQLPLSDSKNNAHQRIFAKISSGPTAADDAVSRRADAERIIREFSRRAFRRPLTQEELERFMSLYTRSAERGDPYEESVKLALKTVLVSPHFLFRVEKMHAEPGIHPVSDFELASRLSYFLWASMPDEQLMSLAAGGKLNQPEVLAAQADRMLNDPKSRAFVEDFVGQWLGTKEVGASVAFTGDKYKGIYTTELAAELREEPIRIVQHLISENRSVLELISADYAILTERTAKHYGITGVAGQEFRRVAITDGRRGGVIGLGAVHMITSYPDRTSPVLRGAWVLETMLGVRVPTPPPDVPPLNAAAKKVKDATLRVQLEKHRENPSCAACHNLMDPIGFGMENFDLLGRWRDTDRNKPIDSSGVMPSGEKFNGPGELKAVLLNRKDEFARHLSSKMLGYALGRSLEDRDDCTIEKLSAALKNTDYRVRTLIKEIVLSTPFRNRQGGEPMSKPPTAPHKKKALPAAKPQ